MLQKIFFIFMTTVVSLHAMEDTVKTVMPRCTMEDLENSIEGMKVTITNPQDQNNSIVIFLCDIDEKPSQKTTTENPTTQMEYEPVTPMQCDPAHSAKRSLSTIHSMQRYKKLKK